VSEEAELKPKKMKKADLQKTLEVVPACPREQHSSRSIDSIPRSPSHQRVERWQLFASERLR